MTISDLDFIPEQITDENVISFSKHYLGNQSEVKLDTFIPAMIQCVNDDEEFNDIDEDAAIVLRIKASHREGGFHKTLPVWDWLNLWRVNYIRFNRDIREGYYI